MCECVDIKSMCEMKVIIANVRQASAAVADLDLRRQV